MQKEQANKYLALGVMSGTSLDGLDLALCSFEQNEKWTFQIEKAVTIPYEYEMAQRLQNPHELDGHGLTRLHIDHGRLTGMAIRDFLASAESEPDFIAMHGHTIFHDPAHGLTLQISAVPEVAAETGITTIGDFRSMDLALGGQGAPLVPIGDRMLFGAYDACLNLGGFANVSLERDGNRMAWDVCPVNFLLNRLANERDMDFDTDGNIARSGSLNEGLMTNLEQIVYYQLHAPKSLGREWFEQEVWPLFHEGIPLEDRLHTAVQHMVKRLSSDLAGNAADVLVTGGGAFNKYLIEEFRKKSGITVDVPSDEIVAYKEALIFAFLGVLRLRGEVNVLSSVTGASADHSAGSLVLGLRR
ncbi:anhydro-N-acetylmuramic acid kinase [Sanyastnella coralliicola]|uniref:anhydro-N-acetylmuramic acid kinase n=1 Tax=Sanyastnella coralliicola TaxID=3069118 RepID=UPI0027BA0A40|nr:anhydro-N-acetylmuramic acid kinase [Longitalea sp. SCSIO 12813]